MEGNKKFFHLDYLYHCELILVKWSWVRNDGGLLYSESPYSSLILTLSWIPWLYLWFLRFHQ